jgi:hypothetical protein
MRWIEEQTQMHNEMNRGASSSMPCMPHARMSCALRLRAGRMLDRFASCALTRACARAIRGQEETAVERVEYQEKQVAADDAKKQLDRDKADLVSARAALNAGLKNAQLREEASYPPFPPPPPLLCAFPTDPGSRVRPIRLQGRMRRVSRNKGLELDQDLAACGCCMLVQQAGGACGRKTRAAGSVQRARAPAARRR